MYLMMSSSVTSLTVHRDGPLGTNDNNTAIVDILLQEEISV
jgi:hypothetical protein